MDKSKQPRTYLGILYNPDKATTRVNQLFIYLSIYLFISLFFISSILFAFTSITHYEPTFHPPYYRPPPHHAHAASKCFDSSAKYISPADAEIVLSPPG